MAKPVQARPNTLTERGGESKSPFGIGGSQRGYHTIMPLKRKASTGKLFITIDIETVTCNGVQMPMAVSCSSELEQNLFLLEVNPDALNLEKELGYSERNLWERVFSYLFYLSQFQKSKEITIFAHNLGGFDGIFLYKAALNQFRSEEVSTLIDPNNKFVSITVNPGTAKNKLVFKDSYRILPVSLSELALIFGVPGKYGPYKPEYNTLDFLR